MHTLRDRYEELIDIINMTSIWPQKKVQTYVLVLIICISIFALGHSTNSKINAQSNAPTLSLENKSSSYNSQALKFHPFDNEKSSLPENRTSNMLIFNDIKLGLKFEIPVRWGNPLILKGYEDKNRYTDIGFSIWGKDDNGQADAVAIHAFVHDRESFGLQGSCHCNTLKDFMAWDFKANSNPSVTFINDNQTTVGGNYPAWQTESLYDDKNGYNSTWITVFAINDDTVYQFRYASPRFDRYYAFSDFKNVLHSVQFNPIGEPKMPSFLTSNSLNSSISSADADNKPQETTIRISSSNDFTDTIGYLHVVGEVKNDGLTYAKFVKIIGTFYDSGEKVVGTAFTYTQPPDIPIGKTAPFELILLSASIPVSQISHYSLAVTYQ